MDQLLSSGADHEAVAKANPAWSEFDWCWYWHRDFVKAAKRAKMPPNAAEHLRKDCGEPGCVCRGHLT